MTETSRKTNLEFGVQNNTKSGLSEIKQDLQGIGREAEKSGSQARDAFDEMVKSIKDAETKIDKSSQGIIRSIGREVVAMEEGGKSTAAYYERIAKQRGADMNALGPYLQQMRLAEKQAEQALGTMGMSAKQTAAAMRGVPAQFTDIFVSLQGGQAPLTVFLQQGGQLKDMFGGAGNAAKALGSYVLGLVNPFTVAAAAVLALGAAYYQGSQEQDAFVKAIVLSGNASGMTSTQLQLLAADLGVVVGSQGRAAEALTEFVRAGVEGSDSLKEYAQAAIDWEKATGTAVADTAKAFAKLQEDPLKAAMELHKGMNFLTAATYEQIRALEEQGDKQAAAKVASDAYKDAINAGSNQIKDNLGYLEGAWRKLGNTASKVWDLMLGAGRAATVADKMGGLRDDIAAMEKQLAEGKGFGNTAGGAATGRGNAALTQQDIKLLQERITLRKQELSTLEQTAKAEKDAAEQKAKEGELVKARDEWNQRGLKFLTDEQKLTRALKEERLAGIKAGASEEEIAKRLDAVRESMAKKTKGLSAAERARNKELSDQGKLIGELSGLSSTFTKDWNNLTKAYARGALSLADLEKAQAALLAKQPFAVALAKEEAEATKARVKAYEEEAKAQDKLLKQRQDAAQKAQEAVQKARDEEEAYAYAAAAGITMAEAVAHIALARAEDNYQKGLAQGLDAQTLLALQQERDARRELIDVMAQKGVREANKKAQDQITKDWEKLSETVGRTLADYIMGGGKDAATYLKRLFATLVLQPVVQYGAQALLGGGAGGSLGGAGGPDLLGLGKLFGGGSSSGLMGSFSAGMAGGWAGFEGGLEMMKAGQWMQGGAQSLGAAAPYLGGILQMASGNVAGGAGTMAGAYIGSIVPGIGTALGSVLGSIAGDLIGGLFDSNFIPRIGGDVHYGSGGVIRGEGTPEIDRQDDFYKMLEPLALGIGQTLDSTAKMFGLEAGHSLFLAFSMNAEKNDVFGQLQIRDASGEAVVDWAKYNAEWEGRLFSSGEEGSAQFMAALTEDVKFALLAMDLPGWSNQLIEAATDLDSLNQALQGVSAIKASFDALGRSMEMFTGISGELQTVLLETAGSMDGLMAGANAFYQGFYSERERMDRANAQIAQSLSELGFEINPYSEGSKGAFKTLVEEAMASGQGELAAKLLAMSAAFAETADYGTKLFEEMAQAAQEAREAAQELAFANLEAAFGREQDYWQSIASASQEAISTLSSTLSLLTSNARALYGTVDSTQQMLAAQGMVYIEDALSAVRGGGSITGFDQLQDAISAARGGISGNAYSTQFERERDALVLAGQLSELGELTGEQLSIEERQLKNAEAQLDGLDQTLKYWRQLLDGNASQIDATLSIPQAIEQLARLMGLDVGGGLGGGAGGVGGAGGSGDDGGASFGGGSGSAGASKPGDRYDALRNVFRHYYGTGDEYGLLSSAKANGYTLRDVTAVSAAMYPDIWGGSTYEQWLEVAKGVGLPAFAGGGMHSGGLRLVGERGWEVEATGPSRIWNQQQLGQALGGGGNSELMADMLAEMRALRAEVAALKSSAELTANNTRGIVQMTDQLDTVAGTGRVLVKVTS